MVVLTSVSRLGTILPSVPDFRCISAGARQRPV